MKDEPEQHDPPAEGGTSPAQGTTWKDKHGATLLAAIAGGLVVLLMVYNSSC